MAETPRADQRATLYAQTDLPEGFPKPEQP
jgi:hypothetical protein